jgi:hypothetical protein
MNRPTANPKIPKINLSAMRPSTANSPIEKIVRSIPFSQKSKVDSVYSYGAVESAVSAM